MQNQKDRWQETPYALKLSSFPKDFYSKQTILFVHLSKIIALTEDDSDNWHNPIRLKKRYLSHAVSSKE